jgi:hypothetical protein
MHTMTLAPFSSNTSVCTRETTASVSRENDSREQGPGEGWRDGSSLILTVMQPSQGMETRGGEQRGRRKEGKMETGTQADTEKDRPMMHAFPSTHLGRPLLQATCPRLPTHKLFALASGARWQPVSFFYWSYWRRSSPFFFLAN